MNWEIPDFEIECKERDFRIIESEPWGNPRENFDRKEPLELDRFSTDEGWSNRWPTIPNMDITWPWNNCNEVDVTQIQGRICDQSALGYYLPYHAVLKTFIKRHGHPKSHEDVIDFNYSLPKHIQYGIHLCEENILNYISHSLQAGRYGYEYEELALGLLLQTVLGHEWGHYRAELNGIQLTKLLSGLSTDSKFNYLEYFVATANLSNSDFEEVFADYCGVKMGVFNIRYNNPNPHSTTLQHFKMVQLRLSQSLFNNRNSPYGDLKFWMKNEKEMDNAIANLILNPKSANKRVKLSLNLNKAESPFGSSLTDVLNHNQIQFISNRNKIRTIVSSRGYDVDFNELDSFWQNLGHDEFMTIPRRERINSVYVERFGHRFVDIFNKILPGIHNTPYFRLPLLTFPDLLPLGPVQIH